jgi:hypothetical protein
VTALSLFEVILWGMTLPSPRNMEFKFCNDFFE